MDFEKLVKEIAEEVTGILIEKNKSYGGSAFSLDRTWNQISNALRLTDKVGRYRALTENYLKEYFSKEKSTQEFFESTEDTLMDIIGYAIIGLIIQREGR